MRKLLFTALAILFGAQRSTAQERATSSHELFAICDVQHATIGGTLGVNTVKGSTGASFGITYFVVVDTAGNQRKLVYGQPVAAARHIAEFIDVEWVSTRSMTMSELMTRTFGKKWPGGIRFEFEQSVTADAVVTGTDFTKPPIKSVLATAMLARCED